MILSAKDQKIKDKASRKAADEKRDNYVANKMLIIMLAATLLIVAMLLAKKNNTNFEADFVLGALNWVRLGLGVLFAASAVYFIVQKVRRADEEYRYFNSGFLLGITALLFALSLAFSNTYILTTGVVVALIAALVLYFIYSFYPGDLFWYSISSCAGACLIFAASRAIGGSALRQTLKYALRVCSILLPVLLVLFMLYLAKHSGFLTLGGKKYRVMRPGYKYYPFYICAAVTAVGSALVMLFSGALVYSLIVIFGALLVIAVIYTINMM